MQQPASVHSSPTPSDFAGLLATLASPKPEAPEDETQWMTNDMGEDATILSYERALRTHARCRPADRGVPRAGSLTADDRESRSGEEAATESDRASAAEPPAAVAQDRSLRTSSVTIRLSQAESMQLRQRAMEAGLTVSAYLRSCAIEAEALRAQVKRALAEIKAGNADRGAVAAAVQAPVVRESKNADRYAGEGVRLTQVLGRIGRCLIGFSAGKPS